MIWLFRKKIDNMLRYVIIKTKGVLVLNRYVSLLKSWCDGLIEYQIKELADSTLNGAFVCPACKNIHGRCDNAMFPMMYMFNETQDEKYRTDS